ncbi:M3 family oligoendopeptidase [Candidatus Nomurabacteria bacterium]|nr:M3 family oligoendopeptidase [Candidatus Nomurabacteria bacterium]
MNKKDENNAYAWNLGVMYSSPEDPKIIQDVEKIEKAHNSFAKKYQNKKFLTDIKTLKQALDEHEALFAIPNPLMYLYLLRDIQSGNEKASALQNQLSERLTKASNQIVFFRLSLGTLPTKEQKAVLKNPLLSKYHYFLKLIFDASRYQLSEAEEKIINLKEQPASILWNEGQSKLLSSQVVVFDKKNLSIGAAVQLTHRLPKKKRDLLQKKISLCLKNISSFSESELNAVIINKKIDDELRGYKNPYSATILQYQNSEKSIEQLVDSVTNAFPVTHRFFRLKAQLLNQKTLSYVDRMASVGTNKKQISFDRAVEIVKQSFTPVNSKYTEIFERYLRNKQIDAFSHVGKKSGAYCWTNVNLPTYVLLNYGNDINSVITIAHEMGHAIHGELSKGQPIVYQGCAMSVAEVASTLFENFVFEEIFKTLSEKEKIIALHDRIDRDISTIFRQIACFNFEVELHNTIREKGALSAREISLLMNKHMSAYLGSVVKFTEDDGYFFVQWSHLRRFFYVYSYAYGQLISKALYKKYTEDKSYLTKIETFLSAGESMSPEDIFKKIGIDTTKPDFFDDGLKQIEKDIERLEILVKNSKKK